MIEMTMREQNTIYAFESETRLQNLSLRAFTTIDQEAIFVMFDHLRRKPTSDGGGSSGCAKKDNFEQNLILLFQDDT